jgi:hypothetical protein
MMLQTFFTIIESGTPTLPSLLSLHHLCSFHVGPMHVVRVRLFESDEDSYF